MYFLKKCDLMMGLCFIVILLSACSNQNKTETNNNWIKITNMENKIQYIDKSSITSKDNLTNFYVTKEAKPEEKAKGISWVGAEYVLSCADKTIKPLYIEYIGSDNKRFNKYDINGFGFAPIKAGDFGESEYNILCSK